MEGTFIELEIPGIISRVLPGTVGNRGLMISEGAVTISRRVPRSVVMADE